MISRRAFIAAAALALPAPLRGDPYRPWVRVRPGPARPVRIRGRVLAAGRGVSRAGISDGLQVVTTAADGSFELVTDGTRRYVSVSPPSGFELPVQEAGTFRLHQPIRTASNGEATARFDLVPMRQSDAKHAFLLLADPQTRDATEMAAFHAQSVPDVRETIRGLGDLPLFGVADGDIMYDDLTMYGDYERAVKSFGIPFAQVVGNHDLDLQTDRDEASTTTFQQHFGPTYYSFDRGEVHYVVLDDVFYYGGGYLGYLADEQLRWLAADLARVERGSPVVVFLHIPLQSQMFARAGRERPEISNTVTNRDALVRLLEPFKARAISGHTHESDHRTEGAVVEHNVGTVCGAWWTGDICYDGTPNGYGVFSVDGASFRWRYKATGQPASHQVRVYPRGADPRAPEEIVANVWGWNPSWTVTHVVNGEPKGVMSRRRGYDPRSVSLHLGPDKPSKRTWIEPVISDHIFYARVPDGASVTVEARDGWGGVYTTAI